MEMTSSTCANMPSCSELADAAAAAAAGAAAAGAPEMVAPET